MPDLRSVGDALLATAGEHTAGLLVMAPIPIAGSAKMLFGGATRHILQNAFVRDQYGLSPRVCGKKHAAATIETNDRVWGRPGRTRGRAVGDSYGDLPVDCCRF